jgi:hypothetical protein
LPMTTQTDRRVFKVKQPEVIALKVKSHFKRMNVNDKETRLVC